MTAALVSGAATLVYVVYEMMNEGDLEQRLPHPVASGIAGLTDLERLTVCRAQVTTALGRACVFACAARPTGPQTGTKFASVHP